MTLARLAARQAIRYENHALNAKYCLCQMLRDKVESPLGKQVQAAQTLAEIRWVTAEAPRVERSGWVGGGCGPWQAM